MKSSGRIIHQDESRIVLDFEVPSTSNLSSHVLSVCVRARRHKRTPGCEGNVPKQPSSLHHPVHYTLYPWIIAMSDLHVDYEPQAGTV